MADLKKIVEYRWAKWAPTIIGPKKPNWAYRIRIDSNEMVGAYRGTREEVEAHVDGIWERMMRLRTNPSHGNLHCWVRNKKGSGKSGEQS